MARQNQPILNNLVFLPCWINVFLAVVTYLWVKYWLPNIEFQSQLFQELATALSNQAYIFAGILLLVASVSAFNAWRKSESLKRQTGIDTIRTLNWQEFEELIREAYRRRGYHVAEIGGGSADRGIDLELSKGDETLLVQCKHWKSSKVGVKVIRELYWVVIAEAATGGIVITSGRFSPEAQEFARGKPLELFDKPKLIKLIG